MEYTIGTEFDTVFKNLPSGSYENFDESLRNDISYLIGIGRAAGADYVELFLEKRFYKNISAQNGVIAGISPTLDIGVGIKVTSQEKNGYACTSSITLSALVKCLENSLSIIGLSLPHKTQIIPDINLEPLRDYVSLKGKDALVSQLPNVSECRDTLIRTSELMKSEIKYAENYSSTYFHDIQEVLVASSDGVFARDIRLVNRIVNFSLAINEADRASISRTMGGTQNPDLIRQFNAEETIASMAQSSQNMLKADFAESGNFPVVLGNAFGGVIFHEACGHLLETTAVQKKSSPFTNSKGEKIAHDAITAWDEGISSKAYGSIDMDDEGMPSQRTLLIENGVLKNFMADRTGSLKTGHPRTGSGRRQNFRFAPASRMRNTWIAPGKFTKDELISSIDNGIYCEALGGGSVQPTGDFNFAAQEAWKIENGKITKPLKGATLVGSATDILKKISMCGQDLEVASGHCGSVSGSIYTTVGQPHLKVDEITVGGR